MARVKTWFNAHGLANATAAECEKRLQTAAAMVEERAKYSMKPGGAAPAGASPGPGPSGSIYWNSDLQPGRWVRSSPHGSPPHTQTGTLRSSIGHAKDGILRWIIGPQSEGFYGKFHEFGKRPFMWPALMAFRNEFPQFFKALNLKASMRGGP